MGLDWYGVALLLILMVGGALVAQQFGLIPTGSAPGTDINVTVGAGDWESDWNTTVLAVINGYSGLAWREAWNTTVEQIAAGNLTWQNAWNSTVQQIMENSSLTWKSLWDTTVNALINAYNITWNNSWNTTVTEIVNSGSSNWHGAWNATVQDIVLSHAFSSLNATNLSGTNYYLGNSQLGFVAPATFIIDVSGLTYRAWHGANSTLFTSSTNASLVIANAIGNLTTGRTWQETVIMRGNATIYAPITLSDKNYTILDCYQARITLAANSNCNMINAITSTHHITIQGGDWDGNKANQGVVNLVGMNFQYVYNSTVRDTVVHDIQSNITQDNSGVCYTLRNCDTVDLVGVQAFRSGKAGIAIMGGCRRIRVDRAFIKAVNSSHTDFYEGIVMYGGDTGSDSIQECTIENCYVEGIGHDPDGGQGIHLYQYCYHNLIANNIVNLTVYSSTGIGSRHNYCDYNSVIGNKIYNTAKNAVGISFCNSDNNQIVGNYIYGCDTGYKQERNADNNQVSSNYFFDCIGGLRILDNGGNYTMIVDNRFYDCDAYDTSIIAGLSTRAHDNLGSDGNWMTET